MVRRLPPLNALRAFEAAGRHESFSGAAEELNVTHAAISRHIRGLEQRLNVQLFRNVARGVELTEAGARFLKALSPAFDQIAHATEDLSCENEGMITISCEPTFAVKWLMPRLGAFNELHPDVEVNVEATGRLADIERYECDLALRFFKGTSATLECEKICHLPVYPIGAPSLTKSLPAKPAPADLLNLRLLHEDKGQLWQRWFRAAGLSDVSAKELRAPGGMSTIIAIEAALAGQGLVLVSDELILSDLESGRLQHFSDQGLDFGGYYLVYLKQILRRKTVRAFRDWLLKATEDLRVEERAE